MLSHLTIFNVTVFHHFVRRSTKTIFYLEITRLWDRSNVRICAHPWPWGLGSEWNKWGYAAIQPILMNQKWEGLGEFRSSAPAIGSIAPGRPLIANKEEMGDHLDLEHEISSLAVPTAYGTVIKYARKTGRWNGSVYGSERREAKTVRRDSGREGDGFRSAGFATVRYCTRKGAEVAAREAVVAHAVDLGPVSASSSAS